MTRQPRPLTASRRETLAARLQELADELTRPQARETQQAIGTAITGMPYPTRTSTVPAQLHHRSDEDGNPIRPDTLTEARALEHDEPTARALELLALQEDLEHHVRRALQLLLVWRPDRGVPTCPNCEHPLPRGTTRCQRILPNGYRCSSPKARTRTCRNGCQVDEGEPLRNGRCNACDIHWRTRGRFTGVERTAGADQLALGDNVLITDHGAAHA